MFAQPTIAGLMVPLINPMQVQQNFAFHANTPDQELNSMTPQVAIAAANLIVQGVAQQHPLRVNAMNVLGQNAFANNDFRNFINHVMRIALAMFEAQQITSIQQVVANKLPELVQQYSAVCVQNNPNIMQFLDQNTAMAVQQMQQAWFTSIQQAEAVIAQAAQRGFNQQGMGGGMGMQMGYGQQQMQPMNRFGTNFGGNNTSGAFVTDTRGTTQAATATNLTQALPNRFQAKLEAEQRARAGNASEQGTSVMMGQQTQQTAAPMQSVTPPPAANSYQERLKRELGNLGGVVGTMPSEATKSIVERQMNALQQTASAAGYGQTAEGTIDWTKTAAPAAAPAHTSTVYDRAMMDATPTTTQAATLPENPVELVEAKPIIREFELNGMTFRMTAMLVEIDAKTAGWKPSKFQTHFPAWCRRTHEVVFAIGEHGDVVAITLELPEETKIQMFEYDAHSIDATKGQPARPIEAPIPDETKKILYSEDKSPTVNVIVKTNYLNSTSKSDLIEQAVVDAVVALEEDKTAAFYAVSGVVHSLVVSRDEATNQASYDQVREVFLKVGLADAAEAIKAIGVGSLRRRIDGLFTQALNDALQLQYGLDAGVTSFAEEAGTIIEDVREAFGDTFADSLAEQQTKLIASVVDVCLPSEVVGHHESMISAREEILNKINKAAFYLVSIASVMVTRFTDDELALGLASANASLLQQDSYPLLYAALRKYFESDLGKSERLKTVTLVTIDGVQYRVSTSPLMPEMFLIKAAD